MKASDGSVIGWENIELISDRPLEVMLDELKRLKDEYPERRVRACVCACVWGCVFVGGGAYVQLYPETHTRIHARTTAPVPATSSPAS